MDAVHIAVRRLAVSLALWGPFWGTAAPGADPPAPGADRDHHNLVLLAPGHPVFLQLRIQVDGQGLKSVRTAYAARLFEPADKNGDRLLDREEAKSLPPLVKSANANETVSVADRWEAVDISPADDKVSLDELAAYIDRVFGNTFLLSVKPQRATQSVDLFPLLDLNHDGRLTRDELEAAASVLHKLDLDEDETYTIDELQPYRNPQIPQIPAAPATQLTEQPFLLMDDDESIQRGAQQLMQRYAAENSETGPLHLNRTKLNIDATAFAAHDADGDGLFDAAELAAFLRNPTPHLVVDIQLPLSKPGKPKLAVADDRLGAAAKGDPGGAAKLPLAIPGISLELKANTVRARNDAKDNRSFYMSKFREAGGGKKGYLTEQEFAGLRIANSDFKSVDRNGDGMVTLEELLAVVEQESSSSQSRVEMSISHDGKSVFEVVDTDHDRRLSRRELAHAASALLEFDRDSDGAVTAVELAGRFQAALEFGRPLLFRNATMMPRADMTNPVVNAPSAGPEWFRKMDRNRDGDVSLREFLGPLAAFKKLDADGDGLISVAEAEKAGAATTPADR
jgi:Ca2+-binding EF-hand superfamily protein